MEAPVPPPIGAGPVAQAERIVALDVLRGFAVLGILVMNIQSFSMIGAAYINPTAFGDLTGFNYLVWLLCHVLADRKFMSIFTMLFGAGLVLMASRREAAGHSPTGVHYRRMGVLLVFGLLHAYLLWYGDVLFTYALCGLLVYLLRKWHPVMLFITGFVGITTASAILGLWQWSLPLWPVEATENIQSLWAPPSEKVLEELATYRGGWIGQLSHRVSSAIFFQTFLFLVEGIWRTGGLMLVGMALYKMGVLSARRSSAIYLLLVLAGFGIGVPVILYGVHRNDAAEWHYSFSMFAGMQFNYWGSIAVAVAWVGLIMLGCRQPFLRTVTRPLAAVGQMALTNYLLETIICTLIFYGHGFGLFGKVERTGQIGVVIVVWIAILVVSPIWLHYFRFGPFEWMWRCLTYTRRQPLRRPGAT